MKEKALFAGGCFWCMVEPFDEQAGIESVVSGYTGGFVENPTYEQVKSQKTGHTEAVLITYNPEEVSYKELVNTYWTVTDPTDASGQFMDRGDSYRPVIYYYSDTQRKIAENSKEELNNSGKYKRPVVTSIEEAGTFYEAEEEHQDFHKKNQQAYADEKEERKLWQEGKHEKQKGLVE